MSTLLESIPKEVIGSREDAIYALGSSFQPIEAKSFSGSISTSAKRGHEMVDLELSEILQKMRLVEIEAESTSPVEDAIQKWISKYDNIFHYIFVVKDGLEKPLRAFVGASNGGFLPTSWTENPASSNGESQTHYICEVKLGLSEARALLQEQLAFEGFANLPGEASFYQIINLDVVSQYDGYTAISRQPSQIEETTYKPGQLYQASNPNVGGERGRPFDLTDTLAYEGLTLI